ncbi:MAG TPA: ribosome-associated translation inhibitor RaiA [Cyclobacteriaceae bacterium]|jgi:putative sigma-54 modulation protein
MKVQIHSIKFVADEKLIKYINKKLGKLEKFYSKVTDVEVMLKLSNTNPENKTVEMKVNVPGEQIFVKEKSSTFEAATDIATDILKRQIKKFKDKLIKPKKSLQKKGLPS